MNEPVTTSSVSDAVDTSGTRKKSRIGCPSPMLDANGDEIVCKECGKALTEDDGYYPGDYEICAECYFVVCKAMYE